MNPNQCTIDNPTGEFRILEKDMQLFVTERGKPEWAANPRMIKTLITAASMGLQLANGRVTAGRFDAETTLGAVGNANKVASPYLTDTTAQVASAATGAAFANVALAGLSKAKNPKALIVGVALEKTLAVGGLMPVNQCGTAIASLGVTGLLAVGAGFSGIGTVGGIILGLSVAADAISIYKQCYAK